jgi:hypothetical protein
MQQMEWPQKGTRSHKKEGKVREELTADDADRAELFKPRKSAVPSAICFMPIISGSSPSLCIFVPLCG